MTTEWLAEALATRDLERVRASMASAGERINDARRHIRSARLLADDDTTLAIAACHDAIRKAVTAHMAANGVRARGGEGAHRITLDYARHTLGGRIEVDDIEEAQQIRQDRAVAEYGDFGSRMFDATYVRDAAAVAERIVNVVARVLASGDS